MDGQKEEIEEILNSLNGIQRAVANPFLFEKIKSRIETRTRPATSKPLLRWALAGALIIAVNVATWTLAKRDGSPDPRTGIAQQLGFSSPYYQY